MATSTLAELFAGRKCCVCGCRATVVIGFKVYYCRGHFGDVPRHHGNVIPDIFNRGNINNVNNDRGGAGK